MSHDFIGKASIDSLRIRIPKEKVQILDIGMNLHTANVLVDQDTGEVGEVDVESMKKLGIAKKENGITTRYLEQNIKGSHDIGHDYILILFNSKLLKGRYYEGINSDTIKLIYNELIKQQVVYFEYEDFLNANFTDTDIKIDFKLSGVEDQQKLVKSLSSLTRPSITKAKGHSLTITRDAIMIQWSKREVATPSSPHLKVYAKDYESASFKTSLFFEKYNVPTIDGLTRIEGTIKNKKHWKYLGYEDDSTLANLLSLTQEQSKEIITKMSNNHLDNNISPDVDEGKWTTSQSLASALINYALRKGDSINEVLHYYEPHAKDKSQRSKTKALIMEVYNQKYKGTEAAKYSDEVKPLMDVMGIGLNSEKSLKKRKPRKM